MTAWALQTWTGWVEFQSEQAQHGQVAEAFGDDGYIWNWAQSTFENWQSEFLQLGSFVIAAGYLVYKGSSERSARRATSGRPPRAPARPGSRSHGGHVGIR
jgi:hypothetical protein